MTTSVAPTPLPTLPGAVPNAFTCVDRLGASPAPSTVDVAGTPEPTTTPVYARLGQDCAATSYVAAQPAPTAGAGAGSDSNSTAEVHALRGDVALAGALVLFTLAALLIVSWGRR